MGDEKFIMSEKIKQRISHVYWSIYLYNSSLTELQIISDVPYNQGELRIVNSHTFDFYRVTLQYCVVMEYSKLMQKKYGIEDKNVSSLEELNQAIFTELKDGFQYQFQKNNEIFLSLLDSDFYLKLKTLRDKKYGHADNHKVNSPFSIKGFATEDFENGFTQLKMIRDILCINNKL